MGVRFYPTFSALLVLLLTFHYAQAQTRNEPVNVNWIFSLPWDVANTLRAPIAGPVSLVLSAFMALMLLFGFLLAPVNYILGYPPRIYHGYRAPGLLGKLDKVDGRGFTSPHHLDKDYDMADLLVHLFEEVTSATFVFDRPENYDVGGGNFTGRELVTVDESQKAPGFLESIFLLVPEQELECRQLLVCHAHGFLPYMPTIAIKGYKLLSKNYLGIPDEYQEAILVGLQDQDNCAKIFTGCQKDLFYFARGSIGLIRKQVSQWILPQDTKDLWETFYAKYSSNSL